MSSLNLRSLSLVTESGTLRSVWVCLLCICPQIAAAVVRSPPLPQLTHPSSFYLSSYVLCPRPGHLGDPPLDSLLFPHIALELGNPTLAVAASPVPGRGKHLPQCTGHAAPGMAQYIVFFVLHKSKSLAPVQRGVGAGAVPWCVARGARGLHRVCGVLRMPVGAGRAMGEGSQKHGGG